MLPGQPLHLALAQALDRQQLELSGPPLGCGLDRGDERYLAGGATPTLAAALAPKSASSSSTRPWSSLAVSRVSITCMIFCFIAQALLCLIPSRRPSSIELIPFLAVTTR